MTVNKISLEEYRYAVILTDSISDLIRENGLKTDDQISAAPKKSHSDAAPLRQKSKLITIRRDDRFGDKMIDQHSAVDYERRGKEQHKGAMAMVTNNSAKEEGIRTSDSKLQVFAAGTPDLESGAKTAARYSKNGEAANTARDLVPAISAPPEVRVENYDAAETKACIYHSPDCVYLADPQGSSMGPGYFGYKPELKEGDIQANLTSDIDPAFNYDKAAAAAAGKEGVDKTTPAPVDDDNDERAATVMADGQANAVKERALARATAQEGEHEMLRYQDIIETLATGVIVQVDEEVSMRIAWRGIADCNVSDPDTVAR